MKWQGRDRSSNIEDRRGKRSGASGRSTGRRVRIPMPGGRAGKGGAGGLLMLVVVIVISLALGINPMSFLDGSISTGGDAPYRPSDTRPLPDAGKDELFDFVAVNLNETEALWTQVFAQNDMSYRAPVLVVFSGSTSSPCGTASAQTGPFYCPADEKIYLDLGFYDQLRRQFGAGGDFAQAYVLAHEVGHHVQQLTGVLPEFNKQRRAMSTNEANAYSVRVELQADCYAGVWASYVGEMNLLERGDIAEALNAAEQIGDDAIQMRSQGFVVPKNFNHGTSEQRQRWFERGYKSGNVGQCDTFGAERL
ncbi:neutral zinc metallopeptidase [Maritalea porphyrae]|uniref:KPN_02809 family neutral zinc metallopeptidase n=1 Tax=Maritalea porphyrae TaxID=880732 RepID=UPI0022AF5E61|nr:neutral zinc metallopeptidase [Maritalea porphyrae]MCZ4274048.1 zinc metallopeptidase [Maritalea porphyrae]